MKLRRFFWLCRDVASMKTCFNSRRNALLSAYIPVCIFFLFSMLTVKKRHVRLVSWVLVCLRGLVVKAHGTLVNAPLGQVRIRQFSFLHLRIGTTPTGFEPTTSELEGVAKQKQVPLGHKGTLSFRTATTSI